MYSDSDFSLEFKRSKKTTLVSSGKDVKKPAETRIRSSARLKNRIESQKSFSTLKTTPEKSGEDLKNTLETSEEDGGSSSDDVEENSDLDLVPLTFSNFFGNPQIFKKISDEISRTQKIKNNETVNVSVLSLTKFVKVLSKAIVKVFTLETSVFLHLLHSFRG